MVYPRPAFVEGIHISLKLMIFWRDIVLDGRLETRPRRMFPVHCMTVQYGPHDGH